MSDMSETNASNGKEKNENWKYDQSGCIELPKLQFNTISYINRVLDILP